MFSKIRAYLRSSAKETRALRSELQKLNKSVKDQNENLKAQIALLEASLELQREHFPKLLWEAQTDRKTQVSTNNLLARTLMTEVEEFARTRQLSMTDTVKRIRDEKLSFVRFGDGEMQFMLKDDFWQGMHKNSPELQQALWSVLDQGPRPNVLLGFPYVFRAFHWNGVWANSWDLVKDSFAKYDVLGVAHATRPVFFQIARESGVELWRSVWEGKRVTVITGEGSRFTLVPDLFDNVRSVDFIYSLPRDAFGDLDRVVIEAEKADTDLFLISLGAAGTILTSRLAELGMWAVDVGHISDSFENVFKGGAWPESKAVLKKKQTK